MIENAVKKILKFPINKYYYDSINTYLNPRYIKLSDMYVYIYR